MGMELISSEHTVKHQTGIREAVGPDGAWCNGSGIFCVGRA